MMTRDTVSQQVDFSNNPGYTSSLLRLSESLHALLHSMSGEEPPERTGEVHDPTKPNESDEELLTRLLENQEDWALERETEISRLEEENERLRKVLNIDKTSIEALGWTNEDDPELTYQPFVPLPPPPISPRQSAPRPLPPGTTFVNMPNIQVQSNLTAGLIPPQRTMENMQGMRGMVGRRPAMFGQRGRGGGPPVWDGGHVQQGTPERPWQAQVGLDLS